MGRIVIGPQKGPQEQFLSSKANICIYGGAAGGGKSYGLLIDPLRYINNGKFSCMIFRRTTKQIKIQGGLWSESQNIYRQINGRPRDTILDWIFPSGMKVQFGHLEHEKNIYDYQGAQIPMIGFDELTHFTEKQFFYMMSRNRSMSGVRGYIRATTNPDSKSWVKRLIQWWIDPILGIAIPERSGILRWFIRQDDKLVWADSKQELIEKHGIESQPKSLTFIPAKIQDNQVLLQKDPSYMANLLALPLIDRMQLLGANWNIEPCAGMFFKKHYFEVVKAVPAEITRIVRCWDRAATEVNESNIDKINPDYTCGVKLARTRQGLFYVLDVVWVRESPLNVEKIIINTAKQDGYGVDIKLFQDPGSAGVYEVEAMKRKLAGFSVRSEKIITNKITNAKAVSAQAEAGNIKILEAGWNQNFLSELENFPDGNHDDQVDGLSGAFNMLTFGMAGEFSSDLLPPETYSNPLLSGGMTW